MIASEVELCNHALSQIGESRIASLTEANERARICNLFYEQTRDELLQMFEWPFAIERVSLASVDESNLTPYDYRYALPNDHLKMLDVLDDSYAVVPDPDFLIEGNRLMSDQTPMYIRYVRRVATTTLFPELFASVFILGLAAKVAPRLSQNFQLTQAIAMASSNAFITAKAELTRAATPRPKENTLWSKSDVSSTYVDEAKWKG